jgi:hypothetical protein
MGESCRSEVDCAGRIGRPESLNTSKGSTAVASCTWVRTVVSALGHMCGPRASDQIGHALSSAPRGANRSMPGRARQASKVDLLASSILSYLTSESQLSASLGG